MDPIISKNIRLRHPEFFEIGRFSVVDDFCYFSAKVKVGICSHIANGCSVAGGKEFVFTLGSFSSLSSGVKIWCGSDDFVNDAVVLIPPGIPNFKTHFISGNVTFGDYTAIGTNSVVMPDNMIPEGTVIGALSFVPPKYAFQPWAVYAGNPLRYIKPRNREEVLSQVAKLKTALRLS